MTKTVRKQHDRFGRFSQVLNIVTTILVVLSGVLAWRFFGLADEYSNDELVEVSVQMANGFLMSILVLLVTLFVHIAIRTVSYIWIGRFWR